MKKTFLGYDLGDGETIIDSVAMDDQDVQQSSQATFVQMTMPDSNEPGRAIPTAYGYQDGKLTFASSILDIPEDVQDIHVNFKRRPSDLLGKIDDEKANRILKLVEDGWPSKSDCPELYTPEMMRLCDSVVTFTDAIFNHPKFADNIRTKSIASDELVICVGHPTRWNDLDVAIYKAILSRSVLGSGAYVGKRATFLMAAESRAAFLYVKDQTSARLPKGTCALLIDIGSSTIDLTAMTADSRNHQYNSGSNYLGARAIDYIIREWYLARLKQNEDDWVTYLTLVERNPTIDKALTLSCRMAKEKVYSTDTGIARITFADFPPVRLKQSDIEEAVNSVPIGSILKQYIGIPEDEAQAMGQKTWPMYFKEFLQNRKAEMEAQGLMIGRIILTGSASKMPFVGEIVREVFGDLSEDSILNDVNPSRSISMGLALVGPSNDKSGVFQADLDEIMKKDVPEIIREDLPALAEKLGDVINDVVTSIVIQAVRDWRKGKYRTLNDMTAAVKSECSGDNLNRLLQNNKSYNDAMQDWAVDVVGQDIAKRLRGLCDKYGVSNITLDGLNVLKVPSIDIIGGLDINPTKDMMEVIAKVISVIAGIITAIILPTVLGVVIGLISIISVNLAAFLLTILLAMPGVGWAILLGIAGIAVIKLASSGLQSAKDDLARKLQRVDLPQWVRNRMTDDKIEREIAKANLQRKIKESISEPECAEKVVASVKESMNRQILKRMEDIKYVIESK